MKLEIGLIVVISKKNFLIGGIFKIFFVFLFLNAPLIVKADDIYDLEIEGISIGDSVLDYFTLREINQAKLDYYTNNTYTAISIADKDFYKTYEEIQFNYLTNDKNYIIQSISGAIEMDYDDCLDELDKLIADFNRMFTNGTFYDKETYPHNNNSGDMITDAYWDLDSGSVLVQCYDRRNKTKFYDSMQVAIDTKEFFDFIVNKAYQ